ncbi:MAG: WYL domain-containing protein, partial [Desulfovibrio sp.]|nr:WYL domain-containing protein [Desulfovibrio sp.]
AADYVRERIWAESQKMEDTEDGGVLLEITTRSEPELMAWVRSFGDKAILL